MEDLGYGRADEDIYLMKDTRLSELLEDEKQRMVFIFDPLEERMFLIELTEIIFGETQSNAVCSRQHGLPPHGRGAGGRGRHGGGDLPPDRSL